MNKPVHHINLNETQQTIVDAAIGFQLILLYLSFGLAGLAGIVYRYEEIKAALGL